MRSNVLTRALVGITAVVGMAAGGLAGATTSSAAPAPAASAAVASYGTVTPLAVVNLGLSTTQGRYVQCWLKYGNYGYTGALDGQLGTESWKAFQRYLKAAYGYTGAIDGIVGSGTVTALQRLLKAHYGYTGAIDGVAGSGTQAAFKTFANAQSAFC
ncbi:peptidoglycan-binding domain-containing protein [Actinacidiphila sp. bgisy160]|uniref:peptidoglycan-binding domain-containing protein n=1 Tax=Actinacidiphila sp. bgisy160 TaxID=3413796 RepID=UPI003D7403D6